MLPYTLYWLKKDTDPVTRPLARNAHSGRRPSGAGLGGFLVGFRGDFHECGLRAGRRLVQEAISQRIYLLTQKVGGTVIQENMIRQLAFSGQWQLLG